MARNKEYNRDYVLDTATRIFLEKGYKCTSISEIVKETGLNKYSLYEEFGNKEGLFKEALSTYVNKLQKDTIALLTTEPLGLSNIEAFLKNRICFATLSNSDGCLMVNSLAEKQSIGTANFSDIQTYVDGYEGQILACLEAAQEKGEVSKDQNLKMLAKYVVNFSNGVLISRTLQPSRDEYLQMLEFLMQSIRK